MAQTKTINGDKVSKKNYGEGIFNIIEDTSIYSSEYAYGKRREISRTTTAKLEHIFESPTERKNNFFSRLYGFLIRDKEQKESTLIFAKNNYNGIGSFPRLMTKDEESILIGSKVIYTQNKIYCYSDSGGVSSSYTLDETYLIEVLDGINKGLDRKSVV